MTKIIITEQIIIYADGEQTPVTRVTVYVAGEVVEVVAETEVMK